MKNGYDHHDHQDIYTYNLSGPKRFILDLPIQSPPLAQRAERSRRDLSALWASRRASAQAVTSKWHFRTTSPINTASSAGEN